MFDTFAFDAIKSRSTIVSLSLDPHADTGALIPSADWVKCCFY